MFAASAQATQILNPAEFEYIHCVAKSAPKAKVATHYVVDVRDQEQYKLYAAKALPRLKTTQMRWQLMDAKLAQGAADSYDIAWVSKSQRLQFNLLIHDNGGQILSGRLVSDRGAVEIGCIDASLE